MLTTRNCLRVSNPWCACAARVTVVVVCLSVKSHLTFGASVLPNNAATYSVGNEGQKFVAFSLTLRRSRATAFAALYRHREVGHLGGIHACASKMLR